MALVSDFVWISRVSKKSSFLVSKPNSSRLPLRLTVSAFTFSAISTKPSFP